MMTTSQPGASRRIDSAALSPSRPGIETSISTTSGLSPFAHSIASRPSAASPQIDQSDRNDKSERSAPRTPASSSTIRIRKVLICPTDAGLGYDEHTAFAATVESGIHSGTPQVFSRPFSLFLPIYPYTRALTRRLRNRSFLFLSLHNIIYICGSELGRRTAGRTLRV